jgi:GTP cyclohydrolase II
VFVAKIAGLLFKRWRVAVQHIASAALPTPWGEFEVHAFEDKATGKEHLALTLGSIGGGEPVLIRLHSECLTGDALFSLRCDCGSQLQSALQQIAETGRGVLLYLRQEGRGIGLINKIRAYHLQDGGADTVEANQRLGFEPDLRDYGMCGEMLAWLGVSRVRLLTNNPRKVEQLQRQGVEVVERIPLETGKNPHNLRYLATKADKLGHLLDRGGMARCDEE